MDDLLRDLGVLSEPARIRLLAVLEREELGVGELCRVVQLPQSTVSRHLKALQVAGWVRRRAEGTSGRYRAHPDGVDPTRRRLWDVVRDAHGATRLADEDRLRLEAVLASRHDGATFYGRMHAEWDGLRRTLFGDQFLLSAAAALVPADWTVTDLGCGTGPALPELAPAVTRVIGVDREPAMLEAAAERVRGLPNVELRQGGLEALPLADAEAHAALCVLVLHHVVDLAAAFAEVRRVLVPGGRLVVVDMVAHDREDWRQAMGHVHLGFERDFLSRNAVAGGLEPASFRGLPPAPDAHGPPLFVALFRRPEGRPE